MAFLRAIRRLFGGPKNPESIVGRERLFGTDSECLDDGTNEVPRFVGHLHRLTGDDLAPESVQCVAAGERWFLRFQSGGRAWQTWFDARDYGAILTLVNEALDAAGRETFSEEEA